LFEITQIFIAIDEGKSTNLPEQVNSLAEKSLFCSKLMMGIEAEVSSKFYLSQPSGTSLANTSSRTFNPSVLPSLSFFIAQTLSLFVVLLQLWIKILPSAKKKKKGAAGELDCKQTLLDKFSDSSYIALTNVLNSLKSTVSSLSDLLATVKPIKAEEIFSQSDNFSAYVVPEDFRELATKKLLVKIATSFDNSITHLRHAINERKSVLQNIKLS